MLSIDDIASTEGLLKASKRIAKSTTPGLDGVTRDQFHDGLLKADLAETITEELILGKYRPAGILRITIPKPDGTEREICIPTVQDRTIQRMFVAGIPAVTESRFSDQSYGFRPGRNAQLALKEAKRITGTGYGVSLLIDLKNFFGNIELDRLRKHLRDYGLDEATRALINAFIKAPALDRNGRKHQTTGVPAGIPLAPLLANIYLHPLDRELERRGIPFVRYADDITVFFKTKLECLSFYNELQGIEQRFGIVINLRKTKMYEEEPRPLLGFLLGQCGGVTYSPVVLDNISKSLVGLLDDPDYSLPENAKLVHATLSSVLAYYKDVDNYKALIERCESIVKELRSTLSMKHSAMELVMAANHHIDRIDEIYDVTDPALLILPDVNSYKILQKSILS